MKNIKKYAMAFVAVSLLLTGCGSKEDDEKVSDITGKKTFVVGMECAYGPFNWETTKQTETSVALEGGGFCEGYDVMTARMVAEELDREIVIKKISWDGLQGALESGDIDAVIAGMTAAESRDGIDFTTPYYTSDMVMVVKKGSDMAGFKGIQQFSGKKVLGQKNTNYDTIIDQIENVVHVDPKNTYPEVVAALKAGEVDAIVAELPVALGAVKHNPDFVVVKFEEGKGFEVDGSVSIGLKKGSKNDEFFKEVQSAVENITPELQKEMMDKAMAAQPAE